MDLWIDLIIVDEKQNECRFQLAFQTLACEMEYNCILPIIRTMHVYELHANLSRLLLSRLWENSHRHDKYPLLTILISFWHTIWPLDEFKRINLMEYNLSASSSSSHPYNKQLKVTKQLYLIIWFKQEPNLQPKSKREIQLVQFNMFQICMRNITLQLDLCTRYWR